MVMPVLPKQLRDIDVPAFFCCPRGCFTAAAAAEIAGSMAHVELEEEIGFNLITSREDLFMVQKAYREGYVDANANEKKVVQLLCCSWMTSKQQCTSERQK